LDLKANAVDVTTGLSTKVDKITGKGLSSTDFTQAEKTKLGLITGTNTGDQDLSSLATKAELEDDYAKLDEENSFSEDQIFEGRIKFGDDSNSNIRVLNYSNEEDEETLEGILISNDEVIFLGKANDDREQVEGWAFDVKEGTL
jgi:CRISPR/Cas system-associated protein Csx1